jgi:N-acetylneuraminic acid mutarotase
LLTRRPRRCRIEALESRRLLAAVNIGINFQPAGSSVPSGYLADTGATYANRGNGFTYGWNASASGATRDRNSSHAPDQRYDTIVHTQMYGTRTWEIAVPNGQYSVHLAAGDADYYGSVIKFNAEGVLVASGNQTSATPFIQGTKTVTVSDGKLTISNASGADNNKLCFIDIQSVTNTTLPTVSIAATDSSASEPGSNTGKFTFTRTGSTSAPLVLTYNISGSAANGSDYNTIASSITIPAGSSSATLTITPKDDAFVEGSENVTLALKSSSSYALGTSSASVTIADNDIPATTGDWPASWSTGPANTRQRWESAAVVMDAKLWNFGGWMSASTVGTHDYAVYDPATNKWTDLGQAPLPVTHSLPAADPAHHVIYFLGGLDGDYPGIPTNKVWKYNTLNNSWSDMAAMPQVHSSGGAVFINNELHYFGGVELDHDVDVKRHIVLNLSNLAAGWQSAPDMPVALDHFSTAIVNGKIYCFGGEFGHDKQHLQHADVQIYDPIAKKWSTGANMPTPKSHNEAATFVTPDGHVIVAGGQTANFTETDEVVEYDPVSNSWTTIGKLPRAMEGPVVQQIGDTLIVTSGNPGTGPIATTWIAKLG